MPVLVSVSGSIDEGPCARPRLSTSPCREAIRLAEMTCWRRGRGATRPHARNCAMWTNHRPVASSGKQPKCQAVSPRASARR